MIWSHFTWVRLSHHVPSVHLTSSHSEQRMARPFFEHISLTHASGFLCAHLYCYLVLLPKISLTSLKRSGCSLLNPCVHDDATTVFMTLNWNDFLYICLLCGLKASIGKGSVCLKRQSSGVVRSVGSEARLSGLNELCYCLRSCLASWCLRFLIWKIGDNNSTYLIGLY